MAAEELAAPHVALRRQDCEEYLAGLPEASVDLFVLDPPFGIGEAGFARHYARDDAHVVGGYVEAPADYEAWCARWLAGVRRCLKPSGTAYVISGWTNLLGVMLGARAAGLETANHCVWKYNFGVNTKNKFVTSHYHVLRLVAGGTGARRPTFNTHCRFGPQDRTPDGRSRLYQDLEDVFVINKEYAPGVAKNSNKLPEALVAKLIEYSSNPGDVVCDVFMGNFTTAVVALGLGRDVRGCEANPAAWAAGLPAVAAAAAAWGSRVPEPPAVARPANAGARVTDEEVARIQADFERLRLGGATKKDAIAELQQTHGRGQFSIANILKRPRLEDPQPGAN